MPLGAFTVSARPPGALTPGDGGRAEGVVEVEGDVVPVDVVFEGTVIVGVRVQGTVGPDPVQIRLDSSGLFGGRVLPTTVEGDVTVFDGVPRAPLSISATQQTPIGTTVSATISLSTAELPPPGGRLVPDVELTLSEVASVRGRVLNVDGLAVSGTNVSLAAGLVQSLALTAADGGFEFVGVPLATALRLEVDTGEGVAAVFLGTVDQDGIVRDPSNAPIDFVELELDVAPPVVTSIAPPSGAVAVPPSPTITITFSEAMDTSTLRVCPAVPTFRLLESTGVTPDPGDPANLCDDSNVVPLTLSVSTDGMIATLTPTRPLLGLTQHTVVIGSDVRDLVGRTLAADVVSQFVTADLVPPKVLIVSPPSGATNVAIESLVRVTFTEPIAPSSIDGATLLVEGPAGPVAGERTPIFGNTVVVFTPAAPLQSDASYTVSISGVRDPAGNVQLVTDNVVTAFTTLDTVAPTVGQVNAPAEARAGETIRVTATSPAPDLASFDFFVNGVLAATRQLEADILIAELSPGTALEITARAIDATGNIGPASAPAIVTIVEDAAPTISIISPAPGTVFSPGETVPFRVRAIDDLGVAAVRAVVSGAVALEQEQEIPPGSDDVTLDFSVEIPSTIAGGDLTLAALATDFKGQESDLASTTVTVRDDFDPVVQIQGLVANAIAVPGDELNVSVRATDTAGVASVSLDIVEIGFSETSIVDPVEPEVVREFVVSLPTPLDPESLTIVGSAEDISGRTGSSEATLIVPLFTGIDAIASLGQPADPAQASSNVRDTIIVQGRGLSNVLVALFGMEISPLEVTGVQAVADVVVPGAATTGLLRLKTSDGLVVPGEALLQIVPNIDSFSVPPGAVVEPGVVATIRGGGFVSGETTVTFQGAGSVGAGSVTDGGSTLTVTVPDGAASGGLTVATDGGTSNGFPVNIEVMDFTIGYWRFEEGPLGTATNPILDSSGFGNEGTPNGGDFVADVPIDPVPLTGAPNQLSMFMRGVGWITFGSTFPFHEPGDATVEMWLRLPASGRVLLESGPVADNGFVLSQNGGLFTLEYFTPSSERRVLFDSVPLFSDNDWAHIAIVREDHEYRLYENSIITARANDASPDLPNSVGWSISRASNTSVNYNGVLDELRFSEAALTPSQFLNAGGPPPGAPASGIAVGPSFSIFNSVDPAVTMGEAVGPSFSVFNSVDPAVIVGEAVGPSFSVFNSVDPAVTTGEAVGPSFSVFNDFDPSSTVGEAVGPTFSVFNEAGTTNSTSSLLVASPNAPEAILVLPPNGALDVGPRQRVVVTFSKPMNPRTLVEDNFTLVMDGVPLETTVSRFGDNRTVVIETLLPMGRRVVLQVTSNVEDLEGNHFAGLTSEFTTSPREQGSVTTQRPESGAGGAPMDGQIVLFTDELLNASTLDDALEVTQNGVAVDVSFAVVGDGRRLVITPLNPFDAGALIEMRLASSVEDTLGRRFHAYYGFYRTRENTNVAAPFLVDVSVGAVVRARFSEALDETSVDGDTVLLRDASSAVLSNTMTLVGDRVTITPNAPLVVGEAYSLELSGELRDLHGSPLAAIATSFVATSNEPASIVSFEPAEGAANVRANSDIRIAFDGEIDVLTANKSSVGLTGDAIVSGSFRFTPGQLIFSPFVPLPGGRLFNLSVVGVEDLNGNVLPAQIVRFTTVANPVARRRGLVANPSIARDRDEH